MKRSTTLCVVLAVLFSAATALAQVTFQYNSQGPATLRMEGTTEVLGTTYLQVDDLASAGKVSAGSVISFSVPVSTNLNPGCSGSGCPAPAPTVQVSCSTGLTSCTGSLGWTYTNPQTLSILFNSPVTFFIGGSITVSSLRVNASTLPQGTPMPLTVSAQAVENPIYFNTNVQTAGQVSTVPAVTLAGVTAGNELSCLPNSQPFSVNVAENYASALRTLADEGYAANVADTLTIVLTNIPKGLMITPGTPTGSGKLAVASIPSAWTSPSDGSTAYFTYSVSGESEGLQENMTFPFTASATTPLDANQPTPSMATVILGPYPPANPPIPLFTGVTEPGSAEVLYFSDCKTYVLFPFVTTYRGSGSNPGSSFDTSISISNTTADPFGLGPVAGGATPQAGTCSLTFYPNTGGAGIPYTTASVPAGGQVSFRASGAPNWKGMAGGYVIGYCNFQNAHSFVQVFNNAGMGSPTIQEAYQGLVLPNPTLHPRNPASNPQCNHGSCKGAGEQLSN